jgi:hypothetical protein
MRQPILTTGLVLVLSVACNPAPTTWPTCLLDAGAMDAGDDGDDGPPPGDDGGPPGLGGCPPPTSCLVFFSPGPDGQCHGVTGACVLPCATTADCAVLGQNSVCLPGCTPGTMSVCTPYQ